MAPHSGWQHTDNSWGEGKRQISTERKDQGYIFEDPLNFSDSRRKTTKEENRARVFRNNKVSLMLKWRQALGQNGDIYTVRLTPICYRRSFFPLL